uniref:Arsenite transporter-like protein n=1 Tax=Pteris vittata TaxID=13821 RepID=C0LQ81_PTEVI|nr:arsenite transporter-like protein [Pteris vittata]
MADSTRYDLPVNNGSDSASQPLLGANQGPKLKEITEKLSLLDRYLYIWILGVMVISIVFGYYVKGVKEAFEVAEIGSVSLPIAIGLWVMMYPVLCKVQYEILGRLLREARSAKMIGTSIVLNWVVGPALMTGLAWATLPDLADFRNGVILVGIARCIAMVLIWNDLAKGDSEYCAILVAINSILQIILYTPFALFYLKVVSGGSGLSVSTWTVAKSVLLFLGIPLAGGVITRFFGILAFGKTWYQTKFLPFIGPWALIGLLYTIFVMFSIQAEQIVDNIVNVVRVAVPLVLYFVIVFFSSLALCYWTKVPYSLSISQCITATGNNFELAIAVAVGSFGIDSKEALAATIGPLIEVPVLLLFVYVVGFLKKKWPAEPY